MPRVHQNHQLRWSVNRKPAYARRIPQKVWEKHEDNIMSLHAEGRTKNQICYALGDQHGFEPTYNQLRNRLNRLRTTTASSTATPPLPSSASQLQPENEIPKSRVDSRDAQRTAALIKDKEDEEDIFKMFTSILDDASEPGQTETQASEHSITPIKEKLNPKASSRSQQKSRTTTSANPPPLANEHARSSPDKPSHADQTDTHPTHPLVADSPHDFSDNDEPTRPRPFRSFSAANTQNLEGASRRDHRPTRKRKLYCPDQDLDSGVPRSTQKTRHRQRYACCACGKAAHSTVCEGCAHKRCAGCQPSLAARSSIVLVAGNVS